MKTYAVSLAALLFFAMLCTVGLGAVKEGAKLEADGKAINVEIGHLVPCVTDWNGDGKKDLIVGQFSGGKIRLYLNRGTGSKPVLKDFEYMKAGGKEISLPAG